MRERPCASRRPERQSLASAAVRVKETERPSWAEVTSSLTGCMASKPIQMPSGVLSGAFTSMSVNPYSVSTSVTLILSALSGGRSGRSLGIGSEDASNHTSSLGSVSKPPSASEYAMWTPNSCAGWIACRAWRDSRRRAGRGSHPPCQKASRPSRSPFLTWKGRNRPYRSYSAGPRGRTPARVPRTR